jgi:hypothetical protein
MRAPSVYTVLDLTTNALDNATATGRRWAGRAWNAVCKSAHQAGLDAAPKTKARGLTTRARVYNEAHAEYENIAGDPANIGLLAKGVLDSGKIPNTEKHHAKLLKMGCTQAPDGTWRTPEGLTPKEQVERFKDLLPEIPRDLRPGRRRLIMAADGRRVSDTVLLEDGVRGWDSTATPLVMGMFPLLTAFWFFVFQMLPWIGEFPWIGQWLLHVLHAVGVPLALASYWPFVVALYQGEGFSTLVKCTMVSVFVPALSLGMGSDAGGLSSLVGKLRELLAVGALLVVAVLAVAVVLAVGGMAIMALSDARRDRKAFLSTFTDKIRHVWWFILVFGGLNWVLSFLPDVCHPIGVMAVASVYPLYFTLGNYKARGKQLEAQSMYFGSLKNLGVDATDNTQQILEASRDPSTFVCMGDALGVLKRDRFYVWAPDEGQVMGVTLADLSRHMMFFGKTGSGKTRAGLMRVILGLLYGEDRFGLIVSDGKSGALPNELRSIIDLMIEPRGVDLAPYQGLDPQDVTTAYAEGSGQEETDPKNGIWTSQASSFHQHIHTLLLALVQHEKAMKNQAAADVILAVQQLEWTAAAEERERRAGRDTQPYTKRIQDLSCRIDDLRALAQSDRRWMWTPGSYARLVPIVSNPTQRRDGTQEINPETSELLFYLGARCGPDRFKSIPDTVHPDLRKEFSNLHSAIAYLVDKLTPMHPDGRQSVLMNVNRDVESWVKNVDDLVGTTGRPWAHLESGVDVLGVLKGRKLALNIDPGKYGALGKTLTKLVKRRICKAVEKRPADWAKRGDVPVIDLCDECQDLVSSLEYKMVAKARSLGMIFVYATQSFEALQTPDLHTDEQRLAFINNFLSLVTFRSTEDTHKLLQQEIGVGRVPLTTGIQQARLNFGEGVDRVLDSVYADPNHPNAALYRKASLRGAARFEIQQGTGRYLASKGVWTHTQGAGTLDADDFGGGITIYPQVKLSENEQPYASDALITEHLATKFRALAVFNRAGHPRADFIQMFPVKDEDLVRAIEHHRTHTHTGV